MLRRSDGEVQVRLRSGGKFVRGMYACRNSYNAMIVCENCLWMVGRRSVGWIDLWSVVGFIASQSDGWFDCLLICQLEVWMVNGWLADQFVRYLVGWLHNPAGLLYSTTTV